MAKRTFEYVVYRKGSNAANQPSAFGWVPIAIVRAASREEAAATTWGDETPSVNSCPRLAAEIIEAGNIDVWANQFVKAVPLSSAPAADVRAIQEAAFMAQ